MDAIESFQRALLVFQTALSGKCADIVQMSGSKVSVDFIETRYVIPGLIHTLKCDKFTFKVWVGANFRRLFFITRMAITADEAKKVFEYTFGEAKKIGWEINFEPIDESEVSIWATVSAKAPIVVIDPAKSGVDSYTLTDEGAFWAVDIPMMIQSCIRTAQRENVQPSNLDPAPL